MKTKKRFALRFLSTFLIMSLLHSNVAWALDPRAKLKKDKLDLDAMSESRPMLPPQELTAFEQRAQNSVQKNQELQKLIEEQEVDSSPVDPGYDLTSSGTQLIDYLNNALKPKQGEAEQPAEPPVQNEPPAEVPPPAGPRLELRSEIPTLTNARVLKVEYLADGQSRSRIFQLEEGENALEIVEAGANGLLSKLSFNTVLDIRPPALAWISEPPVLTRESFLDLHYAVDGTEMTRRFDLTEGINTIAVTGTDAAGNTSRLTRTLTLDTIAPALEIAGNVPALTNQRDLSVGYTVDGIAKTSLFQLIEGENELMLRETDAAGNEAVRTLFVTLDTRASEIRILSEIPTVTRQPGLAVVIESDGIRQDRVFLLKEGVNEIVLDAVNAAGNRSSVTRTVILDTKPPIVTVVADPPVLTNESRITLAYTSDGVQRQKTFMLQEGDNTLTITETDAAGNETVWTRVITRDSVPPALALAAEPPAVTNQPELTVSYVVDGRAGSRSFALEEGANTIEIAETDAAGNRIALTRTVMLDTVAPVLTLSAEPPALTRQAALTVRYVSDTHEKTREFMLMEGVNTIRIVETDSAGNSTVLTRTLTLDTIAPAVRLTAEPPALTREAEIVMSYTSDGQAYSRTFALTEGVNTLNITETDSAENRTVLTRILMRDSTAPAIVLTGQIPAITNASAVTIAYTSDGEARSTIFELLPGENALTIEAIDAAGNTARRTVTVTRDAEAPEIRLLTDIADLTNRADLRVVYLSEGFQKEKAFVLSEGLNTLTIAEIDAAGNQTVLTRNVTLDTLAPAVVLTAEPPVLTRDPVLTVEYTADGQKKSRSFELEEGLNTIEIRERDAAGNETLLTRTLTLDTIAPDVVLAVEPLTLTNKPVLTIAYTSDGQTKSKDFALIEGMNTLTIVEADAAGNQTILTRTVTLDTLAPVIVLAAEPPTLTNQPILTLAYVSDGQPRSKVFHLNEGLNALTITSVDAAGNKTTLTRTLTLDTIAPALVLMGEVPALTNRNELTIQYTSDGFVRSKSFSLNEGANELAITETDTAGNESRRTVSVTLDTQAPQINLLTDIPDLTNRPELRVVYTSEGVQKEKAFTLREGLNTITITETDAAGNPSTIVKKLTLDTIAPAVTLEAEPPVLTNAPELTLTYASDGQIKTKTFTLTEGSNTITIAEKDAAGNETILTRTLTLDTIAPRITLAAEPPTLTNRPMLVISYTSDGQVRSKEFMLLEGLNALTITETDAAGNKTVLTRTLTLDTIAPAVALTAEPPPLTNRPTLTVQYRSDGQSRAKNFTLTEGQNTLTITETDAAGNTTTLMRTITLDTIAPAVALAAEPPTLTNKPALTIAYTSDGQSKSKDFVLVEGANTVAVTETDAAGNSTTLTRTLTLDTIAPAVVLAAEPPTLTNQPVLTVLYTSDGQTKTKDFTLTEGQNTITITETDAAGNQTILARTLTLDTIAPAVALAAEPPTLTNQPQLQIAYTSDGQAKTKSFMLAEGSNTVTITETDAAGNKTTIIRTLTLDTIAPAILVVAEPPSLTNKPALKVGYTSDGQAKSKTFTLTEGTNTISIIETDAAGNQTILTRTLTLDTIAPALVLSTEPPTLTNKPSLTIAYTSDGQSKSKTFTLTEGSNTISITETDAVGNATTLTRVLTLDTIAPAIFVSIEPPTLTNKPSLTIPYTSDGQTKSKNFMLTEGSNTLTIAETDAAGNQTVLTRTLTLDTIAPALVLAAEPPTLTNKPELIVAYTSDGQTQSKNFTLTEGSNTIMITETDAAGNQTVLTRTLTLDTIAPTVILDAEPPTLTNKPILTVTYISDGQTKTKDFVLVEGQNTITITETDAAGNATTLTRTLTLDTIAPAIVLAAEPPTLTNKPTLTVDYTSDGQSKSKIFNLTEGQNTLTVTETDAAGNSATVTRTLTLDTIPPQVVLSAPLVTLVKNPAYTIAYASDGQPKSKDFTLTEGQNTLTVTESDAAGNTSIYTYQVTYKLPPTLVLAEPIPTTTEASTITVRYNTDGTDKQKTFALKPGENIITLTETDVLDQTTTNIYWITSTAAPAANPDPNADPNAGSTGVNLTTANGDTVNYSGNTISSIQTQAGDLLKNISLNDDGAIRDAQIDLADGSVQLYENGQVIGYQRPDKTRIFYKNGKVFQIQSPDGETTLFTYTEDSVIAESPASKTIYNTDGTLASILNKITVSATRFDHGILQSIAFTDGQSVTYDQTATPDGLIHLTVVNPGAASAHTADLPFAEAWLNAQTKTYAKILAVDGTILTFDAAGTLTTATDAEGNEVSFSVTTSTLKNLLSARLSRDGVTSSYDAQGRLCAVEVSGLTIHYKTDSDAIDYLRTADGSRIDNIRLDAAGNIQDAVITTSGNEKRTYIDGHLVQIVQTDETEMNFVFDAEKARSVLAGIVTRDKLRYTFTHTPEAITATLDPAILPSQDTVVQMNYDTALNLKAAIKKNNEVIQYAQGGKITEIITPSEAPKVFAYATDGSYIVTQEHNQSFYDPASNLLKVVVAPHDGRTDTLEVAYKYGKIREVYRLTSDPQARTLILKYSYALNPDGSEASVQIEDVEEKSLKTYRNGVLEFALGTESSVLSTYTYGEADGRVARVELTRLGRLLHTYRYAYEGADTLVTDEKDVVRTYSAAGKLTRMDRDGERYRYSYAAGAGSEEIVTEEITRKQLDNGAVAHYENAELLRVDLADGSTITELELDGQRAIERAVLTRPDGGKKVFSQLALLEEIRPDGTHLFFAEGRIAKSVSADGQTLEYTYDEGGSGAITAIHVLAGPVRLDYDPSGLLTGIKLANIPDPNQVLEGVRHQYLGGVNGPYADDGLFNTAQTAGFGGGSGNQYVDLFVENLFDVPSTLTEVTYRMTASANSSGGKKANNGSRATSRIDVLDAATGQWVTIPSTQLSQNHSNGGGGGSTAYANTADPAVVQVTVSNILGVRAYASAAAYSNGGGSYGGSAAIYEFQYQLADQSLLSYSKTTDALGQPTGHVFSGPLGNLMFDAQGRVASGYRSDYAAAASMLDGQLGQWIEVPNRSMIESALPADFGTWTRAALAAALTSETVMLQEYSSSGVLETQIKADGTVTLFDSQNRASQVLDAEGTLLIEYFYDAQGQIQRVHLKNAREALPVEVARARQSIEEQRAAALLELSRQKNLAYQSIFAQAETQRNVLADQLRIIEAQRSSIASSSAKGKAARNQKADLLKEIDGVIVEYLSASTDVSAQEADAYAALDVDVKKVSDDIQQDANNAFSEVAVQEGLVKQAILKQEVSPIIYDHYRRILGRDPTSGEYDEWISRVDYDSPSAAASDPHKTIEGETLASVVSAHLAASDELAERTSYVQGIKTRIRTEIDRYIGLSTADRESYATALGIGAEEMIQLTDSDAVRIVEYISTRTLHFGQSAFLSLESLLDQKGIAYARDDLAVRCILTDILTGVISPLDDGDLVISVYALNKAASFYGVSLQAANLSWEDLEAIYQSNPSARVIAHISGNHYVIITGIESDRITYIDPGIGRDKHNESLTVAKEGFLKAWQGNVTAEAPLIIEAKARPDSQVTLLSVAQAQSVRGAFWGSMLSILSWVVSFTPLAFLSPILRIASIAVSLIEKDWVSAITSTLAIDLGGGSTIGSVLQSGFATAFQGVAQALGPVGQMLNFLGSNFSLVYQNVTGFIDKAVGFLPGIGSALQGAALKAGGMTLGAQVVNTALNIGIQMGVSKGLTALGVSPEIASFAASLASASFTGALKGETQKMVKGQSITISQAQNIQSSVMQSLTLSQVGRLGLDLGLDNRLTSIVGMSLSAIQGQQIELGEHFDFSEAFAAIKPDLNSSLVEYGVEKIGIDLGLSPVFANALGSVAFKLAQPQQIPGMTTDGSNATYTLDTDTYWDEASGQEMRIPSPSQDPVASAQWDQVLSVIRAGLPLAAAYAAQAHMAKTSAVNQLTGIVPPAPAPTQVPIPAGAVAMIFTDHIGNSYDAYKILSGSNYEIYNRATQALLARYRGGVLEEGDFRHQVVKKSDGTHETRSTDLLKGRITYSKYITDQAVMTVNEGNIQNIRIDAVNHEIQPSQDIVLDADRNVISGSIEILSLGVRLYVKNGKVTQDKEGTTPYTSKDLLRSFARAYIFVNGFNNKSVPEGTFDTLIPPYVKDLEKDGVLANPLQEFIIPLYEITDFFGNMADWSSDFLLHLDEQGMLRNLLKGVVTVNQIPGSVKGMILYGIDNYLVDETYQKLIAQEEAKQFKITDGIVFTHSGGLMPMVGALQRAKPSGEKFDVNTIISYEGVYTEDDMQIDNPNLKRIINVWGTVDFTDTLLKEERDFGPTAPSTMSNFKGSSPTSIENINIRITGAYHNDFSYDENDYVGVLTPELQERKIINETTNEFMRQLYRAAAADQSSPGELNRFLSTTQGITYDSIAKIATVDPKEMAL